MTAPITTVADLIRHLQHQDLDAIPVVFINGRDAAIERVHRDHSLAYAVLDAHFVHPDPEPEPVPSRLTSISKLLHNRFAFTRTPDGHIVIEAAGGGRAIATPEEWADIVSSLWSGRHSYDLYELALDLQRGTATLSVAWFGVDPTGQVDATPALQRAINAAHDLGADTDMGRD